METSSQYQAAQFKVALLLKKYNFGAASAAKYLGKPRGLVQSWMQVGSKHYLAKQEIKFKSFRKILKGLRRSITKEHLDYFLANRLLELELPAAFISKVLGLPTSTVRSWRYGKVPVEVKRFFYDDRLVERELKKLLRYLKIEITNRNLEYFQALNLAEIARNNVGRRRIGGRIISQILTNHYGYMEPIPDKTFSCWINGTRKPWNAFKVLEDEQLVARDYKKLVDELTYQHITYHISKALADNYGWKYSKISKALGIDKELARGWIKKNRGNPVAKAFVNDAIVKSELEKYLSEGELLKKEENISNLQVSEVNQSQQTMIENPNLTEIMDVTIENGLDLELERELIYHLETFPIGVTSPEVLKSILVNCRDASTDEIKKVLHLSKHIIQNKNNGKWMLKKYADEESEDKSTNDTLSRT